MGAILKAIGRLLRSPWFWMLVAAIALCAIAWFVGLLIAVGADRPLASVTTRLIILLGIVILWGLANLIFRLSQERSNERMVDALEQRNLEAERQAAADQSATEEELAAIRHRADEVLGLLRTARFGRRWRRRYVYQLPWYLVVGPPGSGKTTALLNSGLRFPLAERTGRKLFTGIGGTRNCDWLLAEDAVLIDTAGRYTTQDVNPAVETSVWMSFLDLLKRHRPRQPINGVVVMVAPVELMRMTEPEREARAAAIRERLLELRERLGVRFPVYVVFSKLDLVLGFSEFFESLGREDRAQVWGQTFPFDDGHDDDGAVSAFGTGFDALIARLEHRVVRRLQEEADGRRRGRMLDFPVQLATLKPVLQVFLRRVFLTNRYDAQLLLRGFYLTSATQTGSAEDVLADAVAPSFAMTGNQLRPPPEPAPPAPRAVFLQRLFPEVVFAEADLVGTDVRLETARRWTRRGIAGGVAVAAIALAAGWYVSFEDNRNALDAAVAGADTINNDHSALRTAAPGPETLRDLGTTLDHLRALPTGYGAQHDEQEQPFALALYDQSPIGTAAVDAYRRGLDRLLLPDLLKRLESQLAPRSTTPSLLYQTLKVYLMLGQRGPLDRALILAWMGLDLEQRLPDDPDLRADLVKHTSALLESLPADTKLDDTKIATAREQLSGTTLAMRGYDILKQLPVVKELPQWRPIDYVGPAGTKVLLRPSGRSLLDGIDGLYTKNGFFDVFLPSSAKIAEAEAQEGWVLGLDNDKKIALVQSQRIRRDMISLYLDDYARAWDDMLADIVVVPFRSPAQAADSLNVLAGPSSPLKSFLAAAGKETDLDAPNPPPGGQPPAAVAGVQAKVAALESKAQGAASMADQAAAQAGASTDASSQLAQASGALKGPPPGHPITTRYAALKELTAAPAAGQPAPIDATLKSMGQMYTAFNKLAHAPADPAVRAQIMADLQNATSDIMSQKASLPGPVDTVVAAVADSGLSVAAGGARAYMDKVWRGGEGPLAACVALTTKHFPFDSTSDADAPSADFAKLFGPGGTLDQFFNTHLKPYVDTTDHPWRWQTADGIQIHLTDDVLREFERAASLREALFAPDGKMPLVRFEVEPVKLDERVNTMLLDVDGQQMTYRHGPVRKVPMQWPGKEPSGARISFSPDRNEPETTISKDGAWDFLRLLEAGNLSQDGGADQYRLRYLIGDREAILKLHAASVHNLFGSVEDFANFHCPTW